MLKYRVVAFFLGGSKQSGQDINKQLVNAWDRMEEAAKKQFKKNVAGAFIVRPSGRKVEEIPLT